MIDVPLGCRNFEQVEVPAPGAGNQFDYTFDAGYTRLIVGVEYSLVTGVGGGNRQPGLIVTINLPVPHDYYMSYSVDVAATSGLRVGWLAGIDRMPDAFITSGTHQMALVCPLYLRENDHIKSHVNGFIGADQIMGIFIYMYRFPTT